MRGEEPRSLRNKKIEPVAVAWHTRKFKHPIIVVQHFRRQFHRKHHDDGYGWVAQPKYSGKLQVFFLDDVFDCDSLDLIHSEGVDVQLKAMG